MIRRSIVARQRPRSMITTYNNRRSRRIFIRILIDIDIINMATIATRESTTRLTRGIVFWTDASGLTIIMRVLQPGGTSRNISSGQVMVAHRPVIAYFRHRLIDTRIDTDK